MKRLFLVVFMVAVLSVPALAANQPRAGTFTITLTSDGASSCAVNDASSQCNLREALQIANAGAELDTIVFAIPSSGVQTIQLGAPLPVITSPVVIDATTQTGYTDGSPTIYLPTEGLVLAEGSNGSTVKGLIIPSIEIRSDDNIIEANRIGLRANGTPYAALTGNGVFINGAGNGATGNRIGGTSAGQRNVISGRQNGVLASIGTTANEVVGNIVGLNPSGNTAAPNVYGIVMNGDNNSIRSNIASGNQNSGIVFCGTNNTIQRNFVGLSLVGNIAIPNGTGTPEAGIRTACASNNNDLNDNTVSGNIGTGIDITGTGNELVNNLVGVDILQNAAVGNGGAGIRFSGGGSNTVRGGSVAGNDGNGIEVNATGTVIEGVYVGETVIGNRSYGNIGNGVVFGSGANNSQIRRWANENRATVIRNSGGAGIVVNGATGVKFPDVVVADNAGIAVDVYIGGAADGATVNDTGDADAAQNKPVIESYVESALSGTLNSQPSKSYTISLYVNADCSSVGSGEGATFAGSIPVTTDASGAATFTFPTVVGTYFAATATDNSAASKGTSEFSTCFDGTPKPPNLLVNSDFEAVRTDGKPDPMPWVVKRRSGDKVKQNKPGKEFAYEGNAFFRFKGKKGENSALEQNVTTVLTTPGSYVFSLYYNGTHKVTAKKKVEAVVVVKFTDGTPKVKERVSLPPVATYTLVEVPFAVNSAAVRKAKVGVKFMSKKGKLYLDNAALTAAAPPAASAAPAVSIPDTSFFGN